MLAIWNVKYKTIKLLEGNIRENLHDLAFGKIDKLKTFALQNILLKECENNPQIGRKYFQITYLIKDSYAEKERTQSLTENTDNPIFLKKSKDMNRHFIKEDT